MLLERNTIHFSKQKKKRSNTERGHLLINSYLLLFPSLLQLDGTRTHKGEIKVPATSFEPVPLRMRVPIRKRVSLCFNEGMPSPTIVYERWRNEGGRTARKESGIRIAG